MKKQFLKSRGKFLDKSKFIYLMAPSVEGGVGSSENNESVANPAKTPEQLQAEQVVKVQDNASKVSKTPKVSRVVKDGDPVLNAAAKDATKQLKVVMSSNFEMKDLEVASLTEEKSREDVLKQMVVNPDDLKAELESLTVYNDELADGDANKLNETQLMNKAKEAILAKKIEALENSMVKIDGKAQSEDDYFNELGKSEGLSDEQIVHLKELRVLKGGKPSFENIASKEDLKTSKEALQKEFEELQKQKAVLDKEDVAIKRDIKNLDGKEMPDELKDRVSVQKVNAEKYNAVNKSYQAKKKNHYEQADKFQQAAHYQAESSSFAQGGKSLNGGEVVGLFGMLQNALSQVSENMKSIEGDGDDVEGVNSGPYRTYKLEKGNSNPKAGVDLLDKAISSGLSPQRTALLQRLKGTLGQNEKNNAGVIKGYHERGARFAKGTSEKTPWCMSYTQAMLKDTKGQMEKNTGERSNIATQNTGWALNGVKMGKDSMSNPQPGDLVVVKRRKGGHIGFYLGTSPGGNPIILGGNQGDAVSIKEEKRPLVGIRNVMGD